MIASTMHDVHAEQDYRRLGDLGIFTARDGIRWHLIETRPYHYDFSSVLPMIQAAQRSGIQIIWDLFHYGWPADIDIYNPEFVYRFRSLARAFSKLLREETNSTPHICPVNEISFFSWAAGDEAILYPFDKGRGFELKTQLVRAAVEAIEAMWSVNPSTRIVTIDPVIHIVPPDNATPDQVREAAAYTEAQFQSWDMLAGRLWPQLGGSERYLDIIGVNYYCHNQWVHHAKWIHRTDPRYRPFRDIITDVYRRYNRPVFVAETGIEDGERPDWFAYMASEVSEAIRSGVPVEGMCLYPVVNHPGWEDERHCHNGLWDYCNESGHREIYMPLAEEIRTWSNNIQGLLRCGNRQNDFEMTA